jgi:diguanylate cyclase (GGDEF)-like protein
VGFGLWSYAITGAARGAILMVILSSVVYGAFSLRPAQARRMTLGTLAGLGLVMLWRSHADREGYPPAVEIVHFLFTAVALTVISRLSVRLSGLRAQLGRQARELEHAMEQLRLLATRDELTQIHNRRHMMELMTLQCRQQARSRAPLCMALLDIDLFKRINDTWGHHAGDLVLQRFAREAGEVLRASDLLCRWGGEEFLMMFPDTPTEQAVPALARLHERLRDVRIEGLPPDERITFSAGLTAVQPGEAIEAATERADQAMYRAKTAGRDRTVMG